MATLSVVLQHNRSFSWVWLPSLLFCPTLKSCLVFGLIWNFSPFGPLPYFPSSPSFSRGSPPANWFWAALYYPPYKAEARLPINRPMLSNSTRDPPHNFYCWLVLKNLSPLDQTRLQASVSRHSDLEKKSVNVIFPKLRPCAFSALLHARYMPSRCHYLCSLKLHSK